MDSDDAESESPPSQVFRSNKKRVIKYDDEHSIKLTPPTSGPTLEASIHKSHEDTGEASSEFTGEDQFEEEECDRGFVIERDIEVLVKGHMAGQYRALHSDRVDKMTERALFSDYLFFRHH